jgi:hypothetical protein
MISQLQNAINTAFKQAGELVENVTLKKKDPEPDQLPPGYEPTYSEYKVQVVRQDFTATEISNSGGIITSGDQKILLPTTELENKVDTGRYYTVGGEKVLKPVSGQDSLIIDGTQHTIKSVRIKAKSLYILRI